MRELALAQSVGTGPGLLVRVVEADSGLADAGLRAGDRIVAVDGVLPRDLIDLQFDLPTASALAVQRGGQLFEVPLPEGGEAAALALAEAVPGGVR